MEVETLTTLPVETKENLDVTMEEETTTVTCTEFNDMSLADDNNEETISDEVKSPPKNVIESDDDSQEQTIVPQKRTTHARIRAIVDSDSEEDAPTNGIGPNSPVKTKEQTNEDRDSEEESDPKEKIDTRLISANNLEDRYKALVDSDSEGESPVTPIPYKQTQNQVDTKATKSQQKKRKGSARASKEEAMKQIHSETQRLMRESAVSLPYHVPKQRTLEEFMNRKKALNSLPQAPTMAAKLKMSSQIVNQVLEEKEKEAEKFYESSDSEEEIIEAPVPAAPVAVEIKKSVKPRIIMIESIPIEETQKMLKNVQDSRNKIEILQQGETDLGMPRKLFSVEEETKNDSHCSTTSYIAGHASHSVPRKLFDPLQSNGKSEKIESDDDIIKRMVHELISTVESMMQEHVQTETAQDSPAGDAIGETPHLGKEEAAKLLLKEDATFTDCIANASAITQSEEEEIKALLLEDEDEILNYDLTPVPSTSMVTPHEFAINGDKWKAEHEFGLTNSSVTSIKSKLLSNLPPIQPKLRGCSGTFIDLTQNVKPDKKGLNQLIDRFFCKHSKSNKVNDNTNDVTVINIKDTAEGPVPVKETLPYKLPTAVTESPELSKPGAKLVRLQQELKHQMAMKRDEEWKEKERQEKEEEEMFDEDDFEEKNEPPVCDDGSVSEKCNKEDTEEEEEDEEEDEGELDDEMDDVSIKEKKRKSCAFADDEAEVSDAADSDGEEGETDDENEDEDMELHLGEPEDMEDSNDTTDAPKKRKLKRIIKAFDEDSRQSNTNDDDKKESLITPRESISPGATNVDMFDNDNGIDGWESDTENCLPIAQPNATNDDPSQNSLSQQTPFKILGLTPITQLTPLNKVTSASDDVPEETELKLSLGSMSVEKAPTQVLGTPDLHKTHGSQKKLFADSSDFSLSLTNSEKFTTPKKPGLEFNKGPSVSDSQLLELCSGAFTSQPIDMKELEAEDSPRKITNTNLTDNLEVKTKEPSSGIGSLSTHMRVLSSDEEDEIEITKERKRGSKKRKVKQLELSDDEDNANDDEEDEEDLEEDLEETEQFVDYDSEENEVIVVPKKDMKKYAAGFLENEAELSESDWDGSDDEDEKGMDNFEDEDGDDEDIDEDGAHKELGKFHMKRMLDEDQRDVRMLKELLFEDGDLHTDGSGRERRFRWKNIDKLGNDDNNMPTTDENDGYVDVPEDENEMKWRKLRHEREKFVAEQDKKAVDDIDDDLRDSQIFQLGMRALQKSKTNQSKKERSGVDEPAPARIQHTFTDLFDDDGFGAKSTTVQNIIKKRSLLARGEASLARLAMIARQSDSSHMQVNTRNFIFTTITPEKNESQVEKDDEEKQGNNPYNPRRKRKAFTDLNQSSKKQRAESSPRGPRKKPF